MASRLPNPRAPLAAVPALAGPPIRLLLTSSTLLFVELLLIRWIPANVTYVGFFSNFLLMASFLGIGVGILLVLLAILVNARLKLRDVRPLYLALFGSIALAYLLPADALLLQPAELRYAVAAAVAFAPVFFANLVFTYSFRDTRSADMSFASNLLGAMVGGALEYVALLTGFQALLLVVAGLYGLAFVLARQWRLLADQDLAIGEAAGSEGPVAPVAVS